MRYLGQKAGDGDRLLGSTAANFLVFVCGHPTVIVYLQELDGIGAGIYGVAVVAVSADFTRGKGGFNTLMCLCATALATGGVVRPVASGLLVQHLGFRITFYAFAALAALAAVVFMLLVPETGGRGEQQGPGNPHGLSRRESEHWTT